MLQTCVCSSVIIGSSGVRYHCSLSPKAIAFVNIWSLMSKQNKPASEPWLIQFFRRHGDDDPHESVPGMDFLEGLPETIVAQFQSILDAVADAPPPAFSGGGKWEAMHGPLSGLFEVRVQGAGRNHRLFCVLERNALDLGGASIVVLYGLSKPKRRAADSRDYIKVLNYRVEFLERRTVLA